MNLFNISVEYIYGGQITLKDVWAGENCENAIGCDKIYFITDGECEIQIGDNLYRGKKGDAFFIKRQTMHKYYLKESKYMSKYWFHLNIDYNGKSMLEELAVPYHYHFNDFEKANEKFGELVEILNDKTIMGKINFTKALLDVLCYYCEFAGSASYIEKSSDIGMVVKYILDNQSHNITIEELANLIHLQPNYFIRKFKTEVGMSPVQFINRKKYELIAGMLEINDVSIKEIMKKTGFEDIGCFSHFFKKYSGCSPKKYREAWLKAQKSQRKD